MKYVLSHTLYVQSTPWAPVLRPKPGKSLFGAVNFSIFFKELYKNKLKNLIQSSKFKFSFWGLYNGELKQSVAFSWEYKSENHILSISQPHFSSDFLNFNKMSNLTGLWPGSPIFNDLILVHVVPGSVFRFFTFYLLRLIMALWFYWGKTKRRMDIAYNR